MLLFLNFGFIFFYPIIFSSLNYWILRQGCVHFYAERDVKIFIELIIAISYQLIDQKKNIFFNSSHRKITQIRLSKRILSIIFDPLLDKSYNYHCWTTVASLPLTPLRDLCTAAVSFGQYNIQELFTLVSHVLSVIFYQCNVADSSSIVESVLARCVYCSTVLLTVA